MVINWIDSGMVVATDLYRALTYRSCQEILDSLLDSSLTRLTPKRQKVERKEERKEGTQKGPKI